MGKNQDIETGARLVATDFKLPGGRRKKLARLVRDNGGWFDAADARGMAVEDVLNTLTAAGATYADGSSIKLSTLSNALWRRRQTEPVETSGTRAASTDLSHRKEGKKRAGKVTNTSQLASKQRPPRSPRPTDKLASRKSIGDGLVVSSASNKRPQVSARPKNAETSRADVLGFMRRAAAIRRSDNDRD
jgi:hypothetical protein